MAAKSDNKGKKKGETVEHAESDNTAAAETSGEYIRRSYLIRKDIVKAIKVMAAYAEKNDYEIVNELFEKAIPEDYLK